MLLTSCVSEFNYVYRSTDYSYRYEYAKEQYAKGKYSRANLLFGEMVTMMKGTDNGEECLFLYAMSAYMMKDYDSAAEVFKKYFTSYPKAAIKAYQDYIDISPYSERKTTATNRMYELQDKLVLKEYLNAKLYFNLGTYFGNCIGSGGNNYEACIVTSQNALKDCPYTTLREQFASLIMQSKYELAVHSVKEKQAERFQDAEDECYGFMNEYPDSKDIALAEKYIDKCKKFSAGKLTFD